MPTEDENVEEQLAQLEEQLDTLGTEEEDKDYPKAPDKDNVFKFFRYILDLKDSSKVGNLTDEELGRMKLSVRGYQDIANYAEAEKLHRVNTYMMKKGEIVLATSLSRKALLAQLFVTQIKKEQKIGKPEIKRGLFSSKPKESEE